MHSTWFQTGAELGFPGLILLGGFYVLCLGRLWPVVREKVSIDDPWVHNISRMVFAGLIGFIASSQFVSLEGLEFPYFVVLLGMGALRFAPQPCPLLRTKRVHEFSAATIYPGKG